MFGRSEYKKKMEERRKKAYDRVYKLHQKATFLFYVNDAYIERYEGTDYVKLEGEVAKGKGRRKDSFELYDCEGRKKAGITMEEMYCGTDSVEEIEEDNRRIALYPREQDVPYQAGDMICKF